MTVRLSLNIWLRASLIYTVPSKTLLNFKEIHTSGKFVSISKCVRDFSHPIKGWCFTAPWSTCLQKISKLKLYTPYCWLYTSLKCLPQYLDMCSIFHTSSKDRISHYFWMEGNIFHTYNHVLDHTSLKLKSLITENFKVCCIHLPLPKILSIRWFWMILATMISNQ